MQVFDCSVNCGKKKAVKMLQKVIGAKEDGIFGNETINFANNYVLKEYQLERINYYRFLAYKNKKLSKFVKGWINRVKKTIL